MRKIIVAVMLLLGMSILMISCSKETLDSENSEVIDSAIIGKWLLTMTEEKFDNWSYGWITKYTEDSQIDEYYENGKLVDTHTYIPINKYYQFFDDGRLAITYEYEDEKVMVFGTYVLHGKSFILEGLIEEGIPCFIKKLTNKELVYYYYGEDSDDEAWYYFKRIE